MTGSASDIPHAEDGTHVAARKRKRRPGRGRNDIRRGPTRDPGPTANVGCVFMLVAMLAIGLVVLLLELFA
ncbi:MULTISPECIES: hypothetical protein [unclassified Nocardiopsis]|uniref:hypothetical protein n=1 Tax=unclassified Nocardiopsis TaxID=2649073 RepID=UPI0033DC1D4D